MIRRYIGIIGRVSIKKKFKKKSMYNTNYSESNIIITIKKDI